MKTDITVILDRSGSMHSTAKDAIGGFNSFVDDQKKLDGECVLTLIQFDHEYKISYEARPIQEVEHLNESTFVPRGNTALVDAMGRGISALKARMTPIKKAYRPKCIVVIITDGGENASREFKLADVNTMISTIREKGWCEFVFIGANQDAISVAQSYGISAGNSMTYGANSIGTQAAFDSLSGNISLMRSGVADSFGFTQADYNAQLKAGVTQ